MKPRGSTDIARITRAHVPTSTVELARWLLGKVLALRLRANLHLILRFSAGAVIGVAFFDLLPEAVNVGVQSHSTAGLVTFAALGFLFYLVIDRIMLIHGDAPARGPFSAGVLCVQAYWTACRRAWRFRRRTRSALS